MEWVCAYMMLPILFVVVCLIASVVIKVEPRDEPYEPMPSYTDHSYFDRD